MRDFDVLVSIATGIRPLVVGLAPFIPLERTDPYTEGDHLTFEGCLHLGDLRDAAARGVRALDGLEAENLSSEARDLVARAEVGLAHAYLSIVGLLCDDEHIETERPAVVNARWALGELSRSFTELYQDVLRARDSNPAGEVAAHV